MSEGVEHTYREAAEFLRISTCYNLGCRKALSTSAWWRPFPASPVLQPRMSEGVEHAPGSCCRSTAPGCYNLGCRKALSTPAPEVPNLSGRCYNLGCRKALSTRCRRRPSG